jgi:hypothetical protein
MMLSFVAFIAAAIWYIAPWLSQRGRAKPFRTACSIP